MPSSSTKRTHETTGPWKPMQDRLLTTTLGRSDEGYEAARGSGMADAMSGYVKNTLDPSFTDVANDPTANAIGQRGLVSSRLALQKMAGMSGRTFASQGGLNDMGRFADVDMQRASAAPLYDLYAKKLALQQGAAGMAPGAQAMYQAPGLAAGQLDTAIAGLGKESDSVSKETKSNPMGMALTFARMAMGDPTAYMQMAGQGFQGDDSMWV